MSPLVIGVAGGSGSGKTTFVRRLVAALGHSQASVLAHDRYYRHRGDLSFEQRASLNFDHPDALETTLLAAHVRALKAGDSAEVPTYDYARHLRDAITERLTSRPTLIIEGILVLADRELRNLIDIKVFIDVEDHVRFDRRRTRDIHDRGRDEASVNEQYAATVRPMYAQFVEPTRQYADVVVTGGGENVTALERLVALVRAHRPAL